MPDLTSKLCGAPGCYEVVTTGYCAQHQKSRRAQDRQRRGKANNERYNSRWTRYSQTYRASHPRCAMCVKEGKPVPRLSQVTDHIVPVELGGPMFASWNHQALCKECHDGPKQRMDWVFSSLLNKETAPDLAVASVYGDTIAAEVVKHSVVIHVPIEFDSLRLLITPVFPRPQCRAVLVCGAPGSGKSTYVRNHATEGDVIIDLDVIKATLTGTQIHQTPNNISLLKQALLERKTILEGLASSDPRVTAWIVIGGPTVSERRHWRAMGISEVVVIEADEDVVERQIHGDQTRRGREEEMISWAKRWWKEYRRDMDDTVVKASSMAIDGR